LDNGGEDKHDIAALAAETGLVMYSVSQKIPPEDLWQFFQNGWEFFNQMLYAYYAFLLMLECEFLCNYLQL